MTISSVQMPYYNGYNYNCSKNSVPVSVQSPANQPSVFTSVQEQSEEPSLTDQCLTNVALFGGIKSLPHLRHPINSAKGLADAWRTCANNAEALKNLKPLEQGEAFSTLFGAARLKPRMVDPAFTAKLTELQGNYISALKGNNPVEIAKAGAELKTFAARSKKGSLVNGVKNIYHNIKNPIAAPEGANLWGKTTNWFRSTLRKPTVDMAMAPAVKSGAEAAKIAEATKAAEAAANGLKGFQKVAATGKQWFKQGGGWFAVGIEALIQVPELVAAYSEGEKGDGLKQTAKSATTVAINTAGWIAGAKLGALGGAKLGALIGSIFPGAGTAIGAAIGGFVGGLIGMAAGSWGAGKASKAICGKNFTEKRAEEQAKQQQIAQQILLNRYKYNPNYAINPFYNQEIKIR